MNPANYAGKLFSFLWLLCTLNLFISACFLIPVATYANDQPAIYAPAGVNSEGEIRAPVLMELRRDLIPANGPGGLYGICMRVYRALHHTRLSPAEECRRHYNSRQAGFGDMSEFYHTLVSSGQFNQTLQFPLADLFGRFAFRASFVYLSSRGNEPAVMIETVQKNSHVLCVESIKCPQSSTTTTSTTVPAKESTVVPPTSAHLDPPDKSRNVEGTGSVLSSSNTESNPDLFWGALLSGTEARTWFLTTVSLSVLSLLLLIILLILSVYLCRIRRLYARRRCRGTCRFGCRCPPEIVRQTLNSTAVFGPLDSQNTHLFQTAISSQANGSIRSGSGFGTNLFSGGTMTSSRWGSNGGQKLGSPLYVSLANAQGKTALLTQPGNMDASNGIWQVNADQRPSSQLHRRRLSQDAICRSTSEGSSVSGHPMPNGGSKTHARTALISGFVGTNTGVAMNPSSILMSNAPQNGEPSGSVYYQTSMGNYPYSDGGTSEGLSPVTPHSPSQLGAQNANELGYYSSGISGSVGPIGDHVDGQRHPGFSGRATNMDKLPATSDRPETFNSYGSDSLHPSHTYPMRSSEGDLLNITPPSGFYDLNGSVADSALVNGSLTSSNVPSSNPTGFVNQSYLAPLYPLLSSRTEWRNISLSPADSRPREMVGVVEMDSGGKGSETVRTMTETFTFKPTFQECAPMASSAMGHFPPKHVQPSSRVYTASERML